MALQSTNEQTSNYTKSSTSSQLVHFIFNIARNIFRRLKISFTSSFFKIKMLILDTPSLKKPPSALPLTPFLKLHTGANSARVGAFSSFLRDYYSPRVQSKTFVRDSLFWNSGNAKRDSPGIFCSIFRPLASRGVAILEVPRRRDFSRGRPRAEGRSRLAPKTTRGSIGRLINAFPCEESGNLTLKS